MIRSTILIQQRTIKISLPANPTPKRTKRKTRETRKAWIFKKSNTMHQSRKNRGKYLHKRHLLKPPRIKKSINSNKRVKLSKRHQYKVKSRLLKRRKRGRKKPRKLLTSNAWSRPYNTIVCMPNISKTVDRANHKNKFNKNESTLKNRWKSLIILMIQIMMFNLLENKWNLKA